MTKFVATMTILFVTLMAIGCGGNAAVQPNSSTNTTVVPTALDPESLKLIAARQTVARTLYKYAQEDTAKAKKAVSDQKVKLENLNDQLTEWNKKFANAADDVALNNAREHVEMLTSDIDIVTTELKKLESKLASAEALEKKLFGQVFNLAGLGKVDDPDETNKTTEAIENGFKDLTVAMKDGNKKTGELVTAVNGVAKSVDGVKTSVDNVAKSVDALTVAVKQQNDRLDVAFKNLLALDTMNKETASKIADAMNKFQKAIDAANTAKNEKELARIADALEKYLAEKAKAPAPVVTAAPVVAPQAYVQPQVQQGQYYAAPACQGNQCQGWGVRRR